MTTVDDETQKRQTACMAAWERTSRKQRSKRLPDGVLLPYTGPVSLPDGETELKGHERPNFRVPEIEQAIGNVAQ